MRTGFIYLDRFPRNDIAYVVHGFLEWESTVYYPDGVGVEGGVHRWISCICPSVQRAEDRIKEINLWLDQNLEEFRLEGSNDTMARYMTNRFECPLDRGILNFVFEPLDTNYSFKRPLYTIEESDLIY